MKKPIPYIVSLGLFVGMIYSSIDVVVVGGDSMSPLLKSGQKICSIKSDTYHRNNIVVANIELDGDIVTMVKRIYGVEGDSVKIEDNNVYINNELVKILKTNSREDEFVLGKNEYFLLGDNPNTVWVRTNGESIKSRMETSR